jgi:cytochrome c2
LSGAQGISPTLPETEVLRRGEELLVDLGCIACHDASAFERLVEREAPRLDEAGARLAPEFVRRFLEEPHAAQPGARMPDLLASLGEAERAEAVEDLVHFLASRGAREEAGALDPFELEAGRQLYHRVGCVACHAPLEQPWDLERPFWRFEAGLEPGAALPDAVGGLDHARAKFTHAGLTRFLRDPLAVLPSGRMPSLALEDDEARRIAAYLLSDELRADADPLPEAPGLVCEAFEGDPVGSPWAFAGQEPVRTEIVAWIDGLPAHREEAFGFRFRGFLRPPAEGDYTFHLGSDDGSHLRIDGELVVDNGGDHAMIEKSGEVRLDRGRHAIEVDFFERGGEEGLELEWSGPGLERGPIDAQFLSHWERGEPESDVFVVDAQRALAGRGRFEALRCAACHPMPDLPAAKAVAPKLADLRLDGGAGCLEKDARAGLPSYALSSTDRAALEAVLHARDRLRAELDDSEQLDRTLRRFDCRACHARDGTGGPESDRLAYFTASEDLDLGNEGRLPPHLDGVGAKLRTEWLRRVLAEGASVRPYLATRMPRFGISNVGSLAELFARVDGASMHDESEAVDPAQVEHGRRLASSGALGCIQCHDLSGFDSLGLGALDLATTFERIRPAWFRSLMLDPKSIGMNSRMPEFWQRGLSPIRDVLDGDPERQTEALWSWLSLASSMPLPDGLVVDDAEYELVPAQRPILCSVFMRDVSPRTLMVGLPERVHYAFDVESSRLAAVWRGRFFNARGTWFSRAGELESPAGEDVWPLVGGVPFARLANPDDPWPSARADELGYRVLGRRLDSAGRPVFRYALDSVVISEEIRPLLRVGGSGLARRFLVESSAPPDGLTLRLARGELAAGRSLALTAARGAHRELREVDGEVELVVRITSLPARFEVTMWW